MFFGGPIAAPRRAIKQRAITFGRALVLCGAGATFIGTAALPLLQAEAAQQAQSAAVDVAISGGSLEDALLALGRQANLHFVCPSDLTAGKRSPGAQGSMSASEAVRRVLEGTGLSYRFTDSSTVHIEPAEQGLNGDAIPPSDRILVIGEKVVRPYLDTPTSVAIVTEEDIEIYHLDDLQDTFNNMANVRAFSSSRGNNGFEIRGMNADGITRPANSAPLISVVIDGTTQSAEGMKRGARGTWDVERIEVLRGPQSTTQGRNALAGAVIVKTKDPTWVPEFAAKGSVGTLDRRTGGIAVSAPIIEDEVAFRFSGEYAKKTTDIDFADPANELLAEDEYFNLRGKLLVAPEFADGFQLLLTGSRTYDSPTAAAVSGPDFFDREFNTASTFTEFREMDVWNFSADASYEFDNGFVLRSVSAYNDTDLQIESAPSSLLFTRAEHREDGDFTQDLRVEIGEEFHGLSGVAGVFYGNFDQETDSYIEAAGTVYQDGELRSQTETAAVYADLRYRFLEDFVLIAGGRFQHDVVSNRVDLDSDFGPTFSDREATFDVFLPKLGLAYDIDDSQTVSATVSRGYRQGFSEVKAGTPDDITSVDPEFMWTYELAYRLTTPDERLNLGVNLFFNQYKDHQIAVEDPVFAPLSNTRNAGDSISYGAELEGRYDFGNGIQVFGALGLQKSEFGDFPDVGCAPSGGNCEGNSYPEAPAITAALGGVYRHSSGFFAAASANYTDDYYASGDINNQAEVEIDSRFLANAKLGYAGENISVSLYADNIFDKQYITGRSISGSEASIGDGRTVGVEARVRF